MNQFPNAVIPRRRDIAAVWVTALLGGILVWIFVPGAEAYAWIALTLALSLVVAFVIQLSIGQKTGFIDRIAISIAGSVVILALLSILMGFTKLLAG